MKDTVTIVSEAQITPVPVSVLDVVWPEVVGYIEDAAATTNGKYKAQDIYDDIQRGVYVLWIIVENDAIIGALTTRVAVYPNRRSMSIDWIGGTRLEELLPKFHPVMQKYAKDNKCTYLEGHGRGGWARKLKSYGWKTDHIVYNMEL
jgi:hypothetical protein